MTAIATILTGTIPPTAAYAAGSDAVPVLAVEPSQSLAQTPVGNVDGTVNFNIPAQSLAGALTAFGRQAGYQISADHADLGDIHSIALIGKMTPQTALSRLLSGTGVIWRVTDDKTVVLSKPDTGAGRITLGTVSVESALLGSTTEGTGSYTTGAASSATGLDLSFRETPQSVSVTTSQQMEDQNLQTVGDVLQDATGMHMVSQGSSGSDSNATYSRGFNVGMYQVDGVSRSNIYDGFDASAETAIYDRVEIVRGATGLMQGVGEPVATINLVRKRTLKDFQAAFEGGGDSWPAYRWVADVNTPVTEGGNVRTRFIATQGAGDVMRERESYGRGTLYSVTDVDFSANTRMTAGLEYSKFRAEGTSRAGHPLFFADGSLTDFDRDYNSGARWAYIDKERWSLFGSLEHRFENDWKLKADLEHTVTSFDEVIGYGIRGTLNADGTGMQIYPGRWEEDLRFDSFKLELSGPFELFGQEHKFMMGTNYTDTFGDSPYYTLWTSDANTVIGNYFTWDGDIPTRDFNPIGNYEDEETQFSSYASMQINPTDYGSIVLGTRIINWERVDASYPNSGNSSITRIKENGVFTPYVGAVINLTDEISTYASYTTIFQPQSSQDTSGNVIAPKEGTNYEVGVKGEFWGGKLNASAAVFRLKQDNVAVTDGSNLTPSGAQAYKAAKGTVSQGFELEASGEILPNWQVKAGFARAKPQDADGNPLNTEYPTNTFKLFTSYRFGGELDGLIIGGGLRWQGETYKNGVGPNKENFVQESFAVVDLMLGYRFLEKTTLTVNINNAFDKKYYAAIGSTGSYGEPLNATMRLKHEF